MRKRAVWVLEGKGGSEAETQWRISPLTEEVYLFFVVLFQFVAKFQ